MVEVFSIHEYAILKPVEIIWRRGVGQEEDWCPRGHEPNWGTMCKCVWKCHKEPPYVTLIY
jgi:hypothetical protein